MKNTLLSAVTLAGLFAAGIAGAAEKTVTIEVSGLFCASCPYIAAQAINDVDSAEITGGFYDAEAQIAQFVITYDDATVSLDALLDATVEYGYPAELVPQDNS